MNLKQMNCFYTVYSIQKFKQIRMLNVKLIFRVLIRKQIWQMFGKFKRKSDKKLFPVCSYAVQASISWNAGSHQ